MVFHRSFFRWFVLLALVLGLWVLAGCGTAARSGAAPVAEVHVTAAEFSFAAPQTTFKVNTPYRFAVVNAGKTPHEWVLTAQGEEGHAHDAHDEAVSAIDRDELGPGATTSREVVFSEAGTYEFACRLPGHYEAGMKLTIQVE